MKKLQLSALFAAGVFTLAGCPKSEDPADTGNLTEVGGDGDTDDGETGASDKGDQGDGETTGDGDGDTGDTNDTGDFLPTADVPAANTCDPWAQDCPEGEKCAAWSSGGDTWDANKCVPLTGTAQVGDECTYDGAATGTDNCDVGMMCYYTNEEAIGSCIPLCTGSADNNSCPEGFNCSISNDGSLLLCVYSCDPLLQDCSQPDSGCFWDGEQFNCDPAGVLLEGDPCGYINDCSPGHLCLGAESLPACAGGACCSGFCEIDDPQCQLADTECLPFFEEGTAPPGLENTGVCGLPGA